MDLKTLWNKYGVMIICLAAMSYAQFQMFQRQNEYLMGQVDILQEQVATLKVQNTEMNETLKWMRSQMRLRWG